MKQSLALLLICFASLGLFACGGGQSPAAESAPSASVTTTAARSTVPAITSPVDFNRNGIDDCTDILRGARLDAQNRPRYDPSYFAGGYPPEDAGVCTDLVWRAFKHAGYDLKAMVDKDIDGNTSLYPRVEGRPEPNIDFRRVPNLLVFFQRHAQILGTDLAQTEEWQPGDIVTFGTWHVAIVSDQRNEDGLPYILHNMGQYEREDDALASWGVGGDKGISGHFRWDASQADPEILITFTER